MSTALAAVSLGLDLRRPAAAPAGAIGWRQSTRAGRGPIPRHGRATMTALSRLPRSDLAGEASRPRHRDRQAPGAALKIAAKVDPADRAYFSRDHRAAARPPDRVRRRDRRRREVRLPGQRDRAPVPDRLAGAVRPGDDRGDGLRHAGDRLALRLGAGGGRPGRHRVHRRGEDEAVAAVGRLDASTGGVFGACSSGASPPRSWPATTRALPVPRICGNAARRSPQPSASHHSSSRPCRSTRRTRRQRRTRHGGAPVRAQARRHLRGGRRLRRHRWVTATACSTTTPASCRASG